MTPQDLGTDNNKKESSSAMPAMKKPSKRTTTKRPAKKPARRTARCQVQLMSNTCFEDVLARGMLLASDEEGGEASPPPKKELSLETLLQRECHCQRRVCLQQFSSNPTAVLEKRREFRALSAEDRDAWLLRKTLSHARIQGKRGEKDVQLP